VLADVSGRDAHALWHRLSREQHPDAERERVGPDVPAQRLVEPVEGVRRRRRRFSHATHTIRSQAGPRSRRRPPSGDYRRSVRPAREVVAAYWAAANERDWSTFADPVSEDVVYEGPQARERVRGRDAYLRFNVEGFPGAWQLEVIRVVGDGRHAATWVQLTHPDGSQQPAVCFFELDDDGRIAKITDFWPDPYALPQQRAHLVEWY
jgi:ketosteroid isomerase-like protein